MTIDLRDVVPLVTIFGAALAPTVATVWASRAANSKLDHITILVNSQLTDAVNRFRTATAEVEELKKLLKRSRDLD